MKEKTGCDADPATVLGVEESVSSRPTYVLSPGSKGKFFSLICSHTLKK